MAARHSNLNRFLTARNQLYAAAQRYCAPVPKSAEARVRDALENAALAFANAHIAHVEALACKNAGLGFLARKPIIIEIDVEGDAEAALEAIGGAIDAGTLQAAITDEACNEAARDEPLDVTILHASARRLEEVSSEPKKKGRSRR